MALPDSSWFVRHREGFLIAKRAENLSVHTLSDYQNGFDHFGRFWQHDRPPSTQELKAFIAWLYQQPNCKRPDDLLSEKSVKNVYIALRSFFKW